MIIGGFHRFSLIEFPGRISCIIFTQGCNFKCSYCHNPELIPFKPRTEIDENFIFSFLKIRREKLDAVVITGGEPTLQNDLIEFISKIKELKFSVKLETNGSNYVMLEKLVKNRLLDYISMDIKAPFEKYEKITNTKIDINGLKASIDLIKNSKIDYEFRTTVIKNFLTKEDIIKIGEILKDAKSYVLQNFVNSPKINACYSEEDFYTRDELEEISGILKNFIKNIIIR